MAYNKLLARHMERYLPPGWEQEPSLQPFIHAMDVAFNAFDRDKVMSEHAFRVSENDYLDIYARLKQEVEVRKISIEKLMEAIRNMEPGNTHVIRQGEENLLDVVEYLDTIIAKRNEAEEAMRKAKEEAEKAKVEAEKANVAKSEFLSIISHEIRTPLNAIIGLGHILLRQDPRADQIRNMRVLKTSADTLLTLINDILDFSKIGAGKLDLEAAPFDIRKLVNDLFQAHSIKAQERGNIMTLNIDDEIPEWANGDPLRLMQVLNNLLSNAVKFTRDGRIRMDLQLKAKEEDHCVISFSVRDTGVGIERGKLEHIFKPFAQASTKITREYGGTGLGLAITSELLQLMESSILLETEPGKGSTFTFELKLGYIRPEDHEAEIISVYDQDLGGARVLVVEDTPFNILLAVQLLEGWNAVVDVAENGLEAVVKMQQREYDLVLMDLQMPVMDGYTATQKIREFNIHTPIMALTASASTNIREKVTSAGMQDYVSKPFNPDDLFLRLRKWVGKPVVL